MSLDKFFLEKCEIEECEKIEEFNLIDDKKLFNEEHLSWLKQNNTYLSKDKEELNELYCFVKSIMHKFPSIYGYYFSQAKTFITVAYDLSQKRGFIYDFDEEIKLIRYHDDVVDMCNNFLYEVKQFETDDEKKFRKEINLLKDYVKTNKLDLLIKLERKNKDALRNNNCDISKKIEHEFKHLMNYSIHRLSSNPQKAYFLESIVEKSCLFENHEFDKYFNLIETVLKSQLETKKVRQRSYLKSVLNNALGTLYKNKLLKQNTIKENPNNLISQIIYKKKNLEKHFEQLSLEDKLQNKYHIKLYSKLLWDLCKVSLVSNNYFPKMEDRNEFYKRNRKKTKKWKNKYLNFVSKYELPEQLPYVKEKIRILEKQTDKEYYIALTIHDGNGRTQRKEQIKRNGKSWNKKMKQSKITRINKKVY